MQIVSRTKLLPCSMVQWVTEITMNLLVKSFESCWGFWNFYFPQIFETRFLLNIVKCPRPTRDCPSLVNRP